MATRPIFIASLTSIDVQISYVEFKWYPGYAISQKQKSICDFHLKANQLGIHDILEVSSKSPLALGSRLSAFNLKAKTLKYDQEFSVESAFQGSKVFRNGGPYTDLIYSDSRSAKKDQRIKNSGELLRFNFFDYSFKLFPRTLFYDWLYINTLLRNNELINEISPFSAFTDIEFNPKKSLNCQAFSLAIFRTLLSQGNIITNKIEPDELERIAQPIYKKFEKTIINQAKLF